MMEIIVGVLVSKGKLLLSILNGKFHMFTI